jgi:inner membrane protein involved in colicin E2 resistance
VKVTREFPLADGRVERRDAEETHIANAYFLPATLNITGDGQTELRHRGIYDAAVFRAQVMLAGRFAPPDWALLKIDPAASPNSSGLAGLT